MILKEKRANCYLRFKSFNDNAYVLKKSHACQMPYTIILDENKATLDVQRNFCFQQLEATHHNTTVFSIIFFRQKQNTESRKNKTYQDPIQ